MITKQRQLIEIKTKWRIWFEDRGYLIWVLSAHDFSSQYLDSVLGLIWALLKPLALASCYAIVFTAVIPQADGVSTSRLSYGFFLFAGMIPWFVVQESLQRGTIVFIDHHTLVRHHAIPLYFFPLHVILSASASGLFALMVLTVLKVIVYQQLSWHLLAILFVLPLQIIFCFGFTLITSTLTVFIRDIYHLTTTVLYILLFASPILFPFEMMPQYIRKWIWINPITSLTVIYRDLFLFGRFPSSLALIHFITFAFVSLAIGIVLYRKTSKYIVDWV